MDKYVVIIHILLSFIFLLHSFWSLILINLLAASILFSGNFASFFTFQYCSIAYYTPLFSGAKEKGDLCDSCYECGAHIELKLLHSLSLQVTNALSSGIKRMV